MEILILFPILFLTYLVLLLFNSCTHKNGHVWIVTEVQDDNGEWVKKRKCDNCNKEKYSKF